MFPVSGGALAIIALERGGKMLDAGVTGIFCNLCNRQGRILQKNGSGRHARFCFFLQKSLAIMKLQQTLRLADAQSEAGGQCVESKRPVFIEETFLNNQVFIVK